jgi:hypothetical protein
MNKGDQPMSTTRFQNAARLFVAAIALGTLAIGLAAAPSTDAAGLRNCVEVSGPQAGRVGCYELVWADGVQYRMTFSNQGFDGATPRQLDPFYVLAPQTSAAQPGIWHPCRRRSIGRSSSPVVYPTPMHSRPSTIAVRRCYPRCGHIC